MALEEIQNKSVAELKAERDALIAQAAAVEPTELATRYVQALTDAKMRDELLAEQGAIIVTAQQQAADATITIKRLQDRIADDAKDRKAENQALGELLEGQRLELEAAKAELAELKK